MLRIFEFYRLLSKKRDLINQASKKVLGLDFTSDLILGFYLLVTVIIVVCYNGGLLTLNELISAFILWFSAVVVLVYTKETYDMKGNSDRTLKEMRKQSEYERMPFFRIQWTDLNGEVIQIINEGKGIALDLAFKPIKFSDSDLKSEFTFKSRPAVASKGVSVVSLDELWDGYTGFFNRKSGDNLKHYLFQCLARGFKVTANYNDIVGGKYQAVFQADTNYNDKFRIIEQRRI